MDVGENLFDFWGKREAEFSYKSNSGDGDAERRKGGSRMRASCTAAVHYSILCCCGLASCSLVVAFLSFFLQSLLAATRFNTVFSSTR